QAQVDTGGLANSKLDYAFYSQRLPQKPVVPIQQVENIRQYPPQPCPIVFIAVIFIWMDSFTRALVLDIGGYPYHYNSLYSASYLGTMLEARRRNFCTTPDLLSQSCQQSFCTTPAGSYLPAL